MSTQSLPPVLPGHPNLWYPLVRPSKGVQRIVVGSPKAVDLAQQCASHYEHLPKGWTLAVHHHGSQNIAPAGSWHESFLVLPSSGGARALLSNQSTAAFRLGIPLLPGGRLRTRLMRASLTLPGAAQMLSLQGRERVTMITKPENPDDQSALHDMQTPLAVCEGVPGPLRKIVIATRDSNGDHFFKVACTPYAAQSILHETHALAALKGSGLAPNLLARDTASAPRWFAQDALQGVRPKGPLGPTALSWLTSLADRKYSRRSAEAVLPQLFDPLAAGSKHEAFRDLETVLRSHLSGTMLPCTASHGDFTPWNARVHDGRFMAFDWEFYRESAPALFDLFHYTLQTGVLMQKVPAQDALERALQQARDLGYPLCRISGVQDDEIELLAAIYVMSIADRDAVLHRIERPGFKQVEWLESARILWARQLTDRLRATSRFLSKVS
ncbi:MAG: hypothetical protein JKY61_08410 [Planctomycetes bacterium]|nr:hypothetical protein [Planctomycetota bacterium]